MRHSIEPGFRVAWPPAQSGARPGSTVPALISWNAARLCRIEPADDIVQADAVSSRNTATGTISGGPKHAILKLILVASSHSFGKPLLATRSS
jgi:hypothetical protein